MPRVDIVSPPQAKVWLVAYTRQPLLTLATVARGFEHRFEPQATLQYSEMMSIIDELKKTPLAGPLEMVHFTWLIRDVTRAFTHQLVRYRIGTSFMQESLRFSEKREAKVLATTDDPLYAESAEAAVYTYWQMLDRGVPTEDARGILPTNILTHIYFDTSLRTLQNIWRQRMCRQAQHGEWEVVLQQMYKLMPEHELRQFFYLPCQDPEGHCPFQSIWDRPCELRKEPYR
jgi:thymidylate synthase ThyX